MSTSKRTAASFSRRLRSSRPAGCRWPWSTTTASGICWTNKIVADQKQRDLIRRRW